MALTFLEFLDHSAGNFGIGPGVPPRVAAPTAQRSAVRRFCNRRFSELSCGGLHL